MIQAVPPFQIPESLEVTDSTFEKGHNELPGTYTIQTSADPNLRFFGRKRRAWTNKLNSQCQKGILRSTGQAAGCFFPKDSGVMEGTGKSMDINIVIVLVYNWFSGTYNLLVRIIFPFTI